MAENNTTEGIAWWIKPTSDTMDYLKSLPIEFYADANNIEVFDKYVKIKSAGLNVIIPLAEAADEQKEWNEALARGAGDVVQDLAISAGGSAAVIGIFAAVNSTPPGWVLSAITIGGLAITWYTSATNQSFGAYLEQEMVKLNQQLPYTMDELLSDQHLTAPLITVPLTNTDYYDIQIMGSSDNDRIAYNNTVKLAIVNTSNESTKKKAVELITKETQAKQIQINNTTFNITQTNNLTVRNALDDIPEVSLLLTHILIKTGEKIDLGDKGIYTVQSGDTLSEFKVINNICFRVRESKVV